MRVLIVGLGSIAKKHIAALRKLEDPQIFALRSSVDSEDYENVTNLYSLEEVGEIDFDFFLISNPTAKHFGALTELIKFNKPLFVEKPLFSTVGFRESKLVREIMDRGIISYVGCSLRFHDSLKEIKKITSGLRVNEVNSYSGSYLPDWRPGQDFRKSYSANEDMGGGVHIDLIHELDYLYWMFGKPDKSTSRSSSKSSLEINAVDYANYVWEYKGFNACIILNYYRRDTKRTLEVVTAEATFLVDLLNNTIFRNGKEIFSSGQTLVDTFEVQMEFFINNILEKKVTNFNSVDEAYKILELCLKN